MTTPAPKPKHRPEQRRRRSDTVPVPLTPLIGRDDALADITRLLRRSRLLTLTGTGGAGKTRLAQAIGIRSTGRFPDGVYWVDLTTIDDGALVPARVAAALGIREKPRRPILTVVAESLAKRRLLLILDNCEHLLAAVAPLVEQLLRTASSLRILTTSREPLGVPGETTWMVPPLSLPDEASSVDPAAALRSKAVQLFVVRASDADPAFRLTAERTPHVARICRTLDGLPLALELVAAQIRGLAVEKIASRLSDPLALLGTKQRRLRPQHQTLREAINWSYALLTRQERALLARVSVFSGGFTVSATEAIFTEERDVPGILSQLVGKSLIVVGATGAGLLRYRLLDTIRAFAAERLTESGKADATRTAHLTYFLRLAEESAEGIRGPDQEEWIHRLLDDQDNLRTALDWADRSGRREEFVQMAGALWRFWNVEGFWLEGRRYLERALAPDEDLPAGWRARAAFGAGVLAWYQHDHASARRWLHLTRKSAEEASEPRIAADALRQLALVATAFQEHREAWRLGLESLRLFESAHDTWGIAAACRVLGLHASGRISGQTTDRIDLDLASRYLTRSLELAKSLGDERGIATSLIGLSAVAWERDDRRTAAQLAEESQRIFARLNDRWSLSGAQLMLAYAMLQDREFDRAEKLAQQSLRADREGDDATWAADAVQCLADIARERGDLARAESLGREALLIYRSVGNVGGIADTVQGLGFSALRLRKWKRAATLLAATAAVRAAFNIALRPSQRDPFARAIGTARSALGEARFNISWRAGLAMTVEEAVACAMEQPAGETGEGPGERGVTLTEREMEVATLVARGLSNQEIGLTLSVSRRTADSHVQHILNKLNFRSRAQIAAWATALGLQPS